MTRLVLILFPSVRRVRAGVRAARVDWESSGRVVAEAEWFCREAAR